MRDKKQWSLDEVCDGHRYDDLSTKEMLDSSFHADFLDWMRKNYSEKKVSMVDVGCGSGRLLNHLPENVKSYVGLDINEKCINTAKEYFSENKKAKFYLFDIEDDDIQSVVNKKIDIIYIDSTLCMLFKPFDCLRKLFKFCDTIYLGRTPYGKETTKHLYKWKGMVDDSPNWEFSRNDLMECIPDDWMLIDLDNERDVVLKKKC